MNFPKWRKYFTNNVLLALMICLIQTQAVGQNKSGDRGASRKWTDQHAKIVDKVVAEQIKQQNLVGVAVGMIVDGEVVYTKGYGKSDLENGTAVSTKTVFNYASNSKPVVAMLAMQLSEQGKLDLDADIRKYLPEFPERKYKVTTRDLLCHQSGYPHYSNGTIVPISNRKLSVEDRQNPELSMLPFGKSPLLFEPGQKFSYSSYAYVVLSAVIQRAGNQPIAKQLDDRIVKPLKLTSFQLDLPFKNQANWTNAYQRKRDGGHTLVRDYAHYWKHGAGGYKSNIVDFSNWAKALMLSDLIKEETRAKMWTPQKFTNGKVSGFGLGVGCSGSGDNFSVSHGGSQNETKTTMRIYPKRKAGIVVMCNTQGADVAQIELAIRRALKGKLNTR